MKDSLFLISEFQFLHVQFSGQSVFCPWTLLNLRVDEKVCADGYTPSMLTRFKSRLHGVGPVTSCCQDSASAYISQSTILHYRSHGDSFI